MRKLLREFVRCVLAEGAISAEAAAQQGLALYVDKPRGDEIEILLYDPARAIEGVLTAKDKEAVIQAFHDAAVGDILMSAPRSPCNNAYEVTHSAAEQGYGPLLHDIAMLVSPSGTIVPDRDNVSAEERAIYGYYFHRRREIAHAHLDDHLDPKTPPEEDDCKVFDPEEVHGKDVNVLNHSYAGARPNIKGLLNNHKRAWEKLKAMLDPRPGELRTKYKSAGSNYFNKRYRAVPADVRRVER